ncbi:MAG TPA: hypothetical protein VIU94_01750, partial [Streptomyces sp.]
MSVDQDLRPDPRPDPRPELWPDRVRRLRLAAPALLGYAAVRVVGMAVLGVAAAVQGKDALHRLMGRWDAVWYVRIAENGYGHEVTLPG